MASQPSDMAGLRQLYFAEFVPLYDYLSSKLENLPSERHFEVTAAFDHIMRAGVEVNGVTYEAENIAKAAGHLKRATFDAFKLLYKYTTRPLWKKMTRSRYEVIPGFVEKVQEKWYEANVVVERARGLERISHSDSPDQWSVAFEEWKKLRAITDELEQLSVSEEAKLARRKYIRSWVSGILITLATIVAGHYLGKLLEYVDKVVGM